MKILQVGDIHLVDKALDDIRPCLAKVLEVAEKVGPDLIAFTGDIFDSQNAQLTAESTLEAFGFMQQLAAIAPVVGCLGTRSHDGRGPMAFNSIQNVRVASEPASTLVDTRSGPVFVSVLPAMTKQYFQQQAPDMSIEETDIATGQAVSAILADFGAESQAHDAPHVLIGHYTVGGAQISDTQILTGRDIEVSRQQLELARADVVCLGHIHYRQKIGGNIFYNGSLYQKDYGEMDPKGFWIHTIEKIPEDNGWHLTWSTPIDTPTRRLVRATIHCDGDGPTKNDPARITDYLVENDIDYAGGVVRVEIRAYSDEAGQVDKERIEQHLRDLGAAAVDIRVSRIPRANVRSKTIVNALDLRTKVATRAEMSGDQVDEQTLELCDWLDTEDPEAIIDTVAGAENEAEAAGELKDSEAA